MEQKSCARTSYIVSCWINGPAGYVNWCGYDTVIRSSLFCYIMIFFFKLISSHIKENCDCITWKLCRFSSKYSNNYKKMKARRSFLSWVLKWKISACARFPTPRRHSSSLAWLPADCTSSRVQSFISIAILFLCVSNIPWGSLQLLPSCLLDCPNSLSRHQVLLLLHTQCCKIFRGLPQPYFSHKSYKYVIL